MAEPEVVLRLVRTPGELTGVTLLNTEYVEWARGRMQADYGVDLQFESEQSLAAGFDGSDESRARLYLAEIGGEPVGMGGLAPLTTDDAEIKRMYVRPSSRGKGVGRRLLQQLLDDARALGYRTVYLDSGPFMREAHALYQSFGFQPSTPHRGWQFENNPDLNDIPIVFMSLALDPK
jgi:GNAT superfamily N-acetyltransferase